MDALESLLIPYAEQCESEDEDSLNIDRKSAHALDISSHSSKDLTCIRDSLSPDDCRTDSILAPREVKALPGFEEDQTCSLCKVRSRGDFIGTRVTGTGCSLNEFLEEAHKEFSKHDGRPLRDISDEVVENIKLFGRNQNQELEVLLSKISREEVLHHFKYDHSRQNSIRVKDRIIRMLVNMLELGAVSCCEMLGNGNIVLTRENAMLMLQIVDRIQKMATLKDDVL
jgi:hypothetical protein